VRIGFTRALASEHACAIEERVEHSEAPFGREQLPDPLVEMGFM
jgi:hypothetical protein